MAAASKLEGVRFGRLTVVGRHQENSKDGQAQWLCECDCGNGKIVRGGQLKRGKTRSCGCLATESVRTRSITHGMHRSAEYRVWQGMRRRCYEKSHPYYHNYGGRGINVCDEWLKGFEAFYRDMGPRPSLEHTIERKDSDGNYCKDNCHWATRVEQGNNTRRNVYYEFDGDRKTLSAWCRELNINYKAMHYLLTTEMSFEDAADKLIKEGKTFTGK